MTLKKTKEQALEIIDFENTENQISFLLKSTSGTHIPINN